MQYHHYLNHEWCTTRNTKKVQISVTLRRLSSCFSRSKESSIIDLVKYLGLIFDNRLNFSHQINNKKQLEVLLHLLHNLSKLPHGYFSEAQINTNTLIQGLSTQTETQWRLQSSLKWNGSSQLIYNLTFFWRVINGWPFPSSFHEIYIFLA